MSIRPSAQALVTALLAVICVGFALGARSALPVHALLFVLFLAVTRIRKPLVTDIAVVVVLMTLYSTLAEPAFVMMGRSFDSVLARIDRALAFGHDPALLVAAHVTPANLQFFSAIYAFFIPYLWFSILLGCIGRADDERAQFVRGLAITYVLSYLGYLFVPSRGPVEYYHFASALPHSALHDLVLESVRQTGGNHGAFPSLHVGASAYLCLFDLRRNRVRGLTYAPMVVLIAISTLFLRYHYVTDIVTGFAIAFVAAPAARRLPRARTLFARVGRAAVALFFDRIDVEGLDNVPAGGPVLFVANHTNALVDGLVVASTAPRTVSLTAKAALKRNPVLTFVMWAGDIVPFYRRSDDAAEVVKNVDSFAEIRARLARGGAICIFPEGISHSDAAMRELKTGAARIALDFAQAHRGLRIVPVGLHYDAKQRFRSNVLVRFGEPFAVDELPPMSPRELTRVIDERIRAITANFASVREALWLRWTADLVATRGADPRPLDQEGGDYPERAKLLDELRHDYDRTDRTRIAPLVRALRDYRKDLRRAGIAPREAFLSMHPAQALFFVVRELELLVAGSVIAAAGLVQHGLALLLDIAATRKLSKDLDQFASNAIFSGIAIFPLVWLIGIALVAILASPAWALAYALALPFTLTYLVLYFDRAGRAVRRARTFLTFLVHPALRRALERRGRELIATISEVRS